MTTAAELLQELADDPTLNLTRLQIQGTLEDIVEVLNQIRALGRRREVRNLNLSNNGLTYLPEGIFQGLTGLQWLGLNNNQLSALPEGLLQGLTALLFLDLYDNPLITLPEGLFQGLTALKTLHFHRNKLSDLPEGLFQGLTVLQYLDLSENKLSTLPERLFQGLTELQDLSLSRNQLSRLPEGLFQGLTALQTIDLYDNRLGILPLGLWKGLSLEPGHPSLNRNFNFGPEGKIQIPAAEIRMPNVWEVFDRIMAEHSYNLDVLDRALDNTYPDFTFSDEQIKTLEEAKTRALEQKTMLFKYMKEEGVPTKISNLISSMTGYHFKP